MNFIYSEVTNRLNGFFEKFKDYPIDYKNEKPESKNHKRETDELQDWTHDNIEEYEDNSSGDIKLPTSRHDDSCVGLYIIGEKICNPKKDCCICKNRNENIHKRKG